MNREVKFFVKIKKKNGWGSGRGVFGGGGGHRVDVNKEFKVLLDRGGSRRGSV